jgi:hypothetical protein
MLGALGPQLTIFDLPRGEDFLLQAAGAAKRPLDALNFDDVRSDAKNQGNSSQKGSLL